MSNIIHKTAAATMRKLIAYSSNTATVGRGTAIDADSPTIDGYLDDEPIYIEQADEVKTRTLYRTFIVEVASLPFGLPEEGDKFQFNIDEAELRYIVNTPQGRKKHFNYYDAGHKYIEIYLLEQ